MMPSAAPQHSARLEGVLSELSRILPPSAHRSQPVRARAREEAGRMKMSTTFLMATRAYTALKGTLAIIGLAALAPLFPPPLPGAAPREHVPPLSSFPLAEVP